MHVGYGVRMTVWHTSGYDWTDICQPWGEGEQPVLLRCLADSADASCNQTCHRTLFIHKQYVAYGEIGHFLCSVISQRKVIALDRWGGKWNHLLMTHRLTTDRAKNYCNRTLIVKVIVENVVTCFGGYSVLLLQYLHSVTWRDTTAQVGENLCRIKSNFRQLRYVWNYEICMLCRAPQSQILLLFMLCIAECWCWRMEMCESLIVRRLYWATETHSSTRSLRTLDSYSKRVLFSLMWNLLSNQCTYTVVMGTCVMIVY